MNNPQGNTVSEVGASTVDFGEGVGADLAEISGRKKSLRCIRVHFEDHGQDFLWFDIEKVSERVGRVVGAGPFQGWLWNGNYVRTKGARIGRKLMFSRGRLAGRPLNYPITKIKAIAKATGTTDTHRDKVNEQRAGREDS